MGNNADSTLEESQRPTRPRRPIGLEEHSHGPSSPPPRQFSQWRHLHRPGVANIHVQNIEQYHDVERYYYYHHDPAISGHAHIEQTMETRTKRPEVAAIAVYFGNDYQ
ncbi:hypothetical protein BGX31_002308 [Mortierella sp. GBA43]|nr:hypothetical protein BGX31_002308 [Mortierella sp. GBA43]